MEAVSAFKGSGLSNVVFHQLDVRDESSVDSLAKFVKTQFGRLDILLSGQATNKVQGVMQQTYEKAEECLDTNYYGVKRVTQALLPLLKLSPSGARIVNVSSLRSELKNWDHAPLLLLLGSCTPIFQNWDHAPPQHHNSQNQAAPNMRTPQKTCTPIAVAVAVPLLKQITCCCSCSTPRTKDKNCCCCCCCCYCCCCSCFLADCSFYLCLYN